LKAARAKAELERAQRELLEARMREHVEVNAALEQAATVRVDNDGR